MNQKINLKTEKATRVDTLISEPRQKQKELHIETWVIVTERRHAINETHFNLFKLICLEADALEQSELNPKCDKANLHLSHIIYRRMKKVYIAANKLVVMHGPIYFP